MIDLPDDWRGWFVGRDKTDTITTAARRPQPGYAEEPLAEDDPEVLAFFDRIDNLPPPRDLAKELDALKARVAAVEVKETANVDR